MLLLLTLTSSLYHLAFMSVQRFYAIKWPLKYRRQGNKCSTAVLVPVWILSFLSASAPGNSNLSILLHCKYVFILLLCNKRRWYAWIRTVQTKLFSMEQKERYRKNHKRNIETVRIYNFSKNAFLFQAGCQPTPGSHIITHCSYITQHPFKKISHQTITKQNSSWFFSTVFRCLLW